MGLIDDEDEYFARMAALTARKRELSATPVRAASWETVEDGETYAEKYAVADDAGRREIMRNASIRLTVHANGEPTIHVPAVLADILGGDDVPVLLETPGYQRLISNYVRAGMRGDRD